MMIKLPCLAIPFTFKALEKIKLPEYCFFLGGGGIGKGEYNAMQGNFVPLF